MKQFYESSLLHTNTITFGGHFTNFNLGFTQNLKEIEIFAVAKKNHNCLKFNWVNKLFVSGYWLPSHIGKSKKVDIYCSF
jgi:hypothetical protein